MSLLPNHLAMIRASAISEEVAQRRGYRTVQEAGELEALGFSPAQRRVPGLLVPIRNVAGEVVLHTYRPDSPREQKRDGKVRVVKYEFPADCKMRLDVPAGTAAAVRDVNRRLWVVEGCKKADAIVSVGEVAIGLAGVWNWRGTNGTGGKATLPDWDSVPVNGREVVVGFDSDLSTNANVAKAADRLAAWLASRGARVTIARIPHGPNGAKAGIDDYLHAGGRLEDLPLVQPGLLVAGKRMAKGDSEDLVGLLLGLTDLANAKRLVEWHGHDLRHVHGHGWMTYEVGRWCRDETGEVLRRAESTVRRMVEEAAKGLPSAEAKASVVAATRAANGKSFAAMVKLAEHQPGVAMRAEVLDRDPLLFNVANGTLRLDTGELLPHRREDHLTLQSPVPFDPSAEAPRWVAFLEEIVPDADVREFLRRLLGYCMSGLVRDHVLPILHGSGQNGKSVLIDTVLRVMGRYAAPIAPDLLMSNGHDRHPTERARLRGLRMAVVHETAEGGRLNESAAKALTGGDQIAARHMREDFFEFSPTHKLLVVTNHRPEIRGTDLGIWRRLRLIPFGVTIPEERRDPKMVEKLLAEAPGILRWLAEGARDYLAGGLTAPEAVVAATSAYRTDSDLLGQWLEERCVVGLAYRAKSAHLHADFATYCEQAGERLLSRRAFGTLLHERGFLDHKSGGVAWWIGLALRGPGDEHPDETDLGSMGRITGKTRLTARENASRRDQPENGHRSSPSSPRPNGELPLDADYLAERLAIQAEGEP